MGQANEGMTVMAVTDHQADTLRALLAGDFGEHARLRAQLDRDADREGYSALITAGFFLAADRRFAQSHTRDDITGFVASARATSADAAGQIDPLIAERLIRGVFEDEDMHDVPGQRLTETQVMLLTALVSEAWLTAPELDAFLADSRKLADRWTS
jgi:hypothetical protein